MRLDAVQRTLVVVCLMCGLWALIVALSGGGTFHLGSLRVIDLRTQSAAARPCERIAGLGPGAHRF